MVHCQLCQFALSEVEIHCRLRPICGLANKLADSFTPSVSRIRAIRVLWHGIDLGRYYCLDCRRPPPGPQSVQAGRAYLVYQSEDEVQDTVPPDLQHH